MQVPVSLSTMPVSSAALILAFFLLFTDIEKLFSPGSSHMTIQSYTPIRFIEFGGGGGGGGVQALASFVHYQIMTTCWVQEVTQWGKL